MVLAAGASRLWLLPLHVSSDVNEGWNAYHAASAVRLAALYTAPGALVGTNYPPLSFLLVGALGRLSGLDLVIVGRLLALLGCALTGFLLCRLACRLMPDHRAAAGWVALGFAGLATTLFRRYLAMDDPQWLAQAMMTVGLLIVVPPRADARPGKTAVTAAAVVIVGAGFIKHNAVAMPLAITLWLSVWHRSRLPAWLAASAIALALGFGLCWLAYGPDCLSALLHPRRMYSGSRAATKSAPVLALLLPLALAGWAGASGKADTRRWLVMLIGLIALPVGCLARGGAGVDVNVHFDAAAALVLAAGIAVAEARGPRRRVLGACLLLPALAAWPFAVVASGREWRQADRQLLAWQESVARVAAIPGPVACRTPALCYWAGKDFGLDWFLYEQHMRVTGDRRALDAAIAERRFTAVQLAPGPDDPLRDALLAAYPDTTPIPLGTLQRPR